MLGLGEQSPLLPGPCPPSSSTRMGYSSHFPLAVSWGHTMLRKAEPRVLSDWPWLETCGHKRVQRTGSESPEMEGTGLPGSLRKRSFNKDSGP